jgi:enoyl-CoA hydratase/carnithine racemase
MGENQVILRFEDRDPQGRVATIILNNDKNLNSLNSGLMQEFLQKVSPLRGDKHLRAVVLTGAGERSFIGGANLFELRDLTPESARDFLTLIHEVASILREIPVPVIARINGFCLGAGPEVAAACDMRIATENAVFGMPEVKVGLPSVIEAALLPQLIGWGRARLLCFTGENITAREALTWGLVEKVVPPSDLDEAVEEWVASILAAGPKAIRLQKELFGYWEKMSLSDALQEGIRSISKAYGTDEPSRMLTEQIRRLRNRGR